MVEVIGSYIEFKYCDCGCGFTHPKYQTQRGKPRRDRPNKFIYGHQNRPQEIKNKISIANKGENNGMYSGDLGKYGAIHYWIRRYLPQKNLCELCNKTPPRDVACITGIYNREFKNWARLCRSCNLKWDNVGVRNKIRRS